MKNIAKSLLLFVVMGIMLFALTGCGNKLVATKSQSDSMFGDYEEKIEVSFKNNKADKVTYTMKFKEEDKAKKAESLLSAGLALSGEDNLKVERKGKNVTMKMDGDIFADQEGMDKDSLTKEKIKENLEKEGYKVK